MKAKLISQISNDRCELQDVIPLATPWVIYIEPSGYCNLRCNFCPQHDSKMLKSKMSFTLFKKAIDQLLKFKAKIKMLRICGNGEPLMNKDIVEMAKYASESNIFEKIELVTNGTLLNKYLIDNLPKYITRFVISIEGLNEEDYEAMTSVRVDFNKLMNDIEALYNNKLDSTIMIKTVNHAVKTSEKQELFFKIFHDICDEIFIENLVPMWPGLDSKYRIDYRWDKNKEALERIVCVQIFKGMQIQANGDVVPCCVDWERANRLGNIKETHIKSIWKSQTLKQLRLFHLEGRKKDVYPCAKCVMNDTCDPDNIDNQRKELYKRILKDESN